MAGDENPPDSTGGASRREAPTLRGAIDRYVEGVNSDIANGRDLDAAAKYRRQAVMVPAFCVLALATVWAVCLVAVVAMGLNYVQLSPDTLLWGLSILASTSGGSVIAWRIRIRRARTRRSRRDISTEHGGQEAEQTA